LTSTAHRRLHEYRACDIGLLRAAVAAMEGTHDFTAFANQNWKGKAALNPIRTVHKVRTRHH
jgi:tRNA U38,U39,U40 pseudouridine synthase TruA